MYLRSFLLRLAPLLLLSSTLSQPALAQIVPPTPIELGSTEGRLDANTPRRASNHAFACYALDTKAGEEVSVRLTSSAFDPVLEVARGALCNAASLQYENDNASDTSNDARINFRAAGGRYLILVRGVSASSQGAYQLELDTGVQAVAQNQPEISDDAQRRRQIMEKEIQKRKAEIAAAEAKRKAEQERQAQQHAAWLAQQRELERYNQYDNYDDYEDDYESAPAPNPFNVFATTLANELNNQQRQQAEFQRGLEDAVRRGEAERERRLAAQRAQESQQRQEQAMRQAAAQQAQAAQAQRLADERARAAAEASQRVAQAGSAQRTNDRIVAHPVGGQSTTNSSSDANRASTRNDPSTCVAGPELVKNPNCPNGAGSRVTNQCAHAIDARICHWTTQERWDCGTTSVNPGNTGGYPSCFGTGRMWMQVRYSDAKTRFSNPP